VRKNMKANKGFTLIELLIVIAVIAILAAIAIPNLLSSRKAANESSAISSLRTLVSAQETFRARSASHLYASSLTGANTVALFVADGDAANLIDPVLATGIKSGYTFSAPVSTDAFANTYGFTAAPTTVGSSGDRFFSVDQTGVIRAGSAAVAVGAGTPIQ
jgi:prepilin-type N-terminal cleavage/methylation domain-containing protein